MVQMSRKIGRPREFDYDIALDAAMQLFWARGFSATSLDDLARAMQMKRPSMYNAFGDKKAIYRLALARFCDRLDAEIGEVLSAADLRDALTRFYDGALAVYFSAEPSPGCMMMCTAPVEALAHPDVRDDLRDLIRRVDAALESALERAQARGEVSMDCDRRAAAQLIQAVLHSLALRARAGESKRAMRRLIRFAIACVVDGEVRD
jgi:TetR/AcrR family transcriptional regulator, copper-responsive repressor